MAQSHLQEHLTRADLSHLEERIRIETMLRRDGPRFLMELVALLIAVAVGSVTVWEALRH